MSITVNNATALQNAVNNPPADGMIYIGSSFTLSTPINVAACTTCTIESSPGSSYTLTSNPNTTAITI